MIIKRTSRRLLELLRENEALRAHVGEAEPQQEPEQEGEGELTAPVTLVTKTNDLEAAVEAITEVLL